MSKSQGPQTMSANLRGIRKFRKGFTIEGSWKGSNDEKAKPEMTKHEQNYQKTEKILSKKQ